jgi:hypothetical protein
VSATETEGADEAGSRVPRQPQRRLGHSRLIRLLTDLKAQRRAIISANRAHFLFYSNLKDIPDAYEVIVGGLRARDGELWPGRPDST